MKFYEISVSSDWPHNLGIRGYISKVRVTLVKIYFRSTSLTYPTIRYRKRLEISDFLFCKFLSKNFHPLGRQS